MDKKIGVFSFFAGAGFLDLGFEQAGAYEILFVNEFHKPFVDIYINSRKKMQINLPLLGVENEDITTYITSTKINWFKNHIETLRNNFRLIGFIGGPPCPDFSIGGKNRGHNGENGKLSGTYVELISKTKPDFFVFENVKGLYRTAKHRQFFDMMKSKLKRNGYALTEKLINAIEYGAPQDRERIILIGFRKEILKDAHVSIKKGSIISNFNWDSHTEYDAENIFSLNWAITDRFRPDSELEFLNNVPNELTVEFWFRKNDVENHPNANHHFTPRAGLKRFEEVDEGDDSKKSFKRLHRWRYSPTAAYGNNEVHLHPYKARRISASEALAIQTLPKEFIIPEYISLSNMFKAIGNGVPFLAAKGLASTIIEFINNHELHFKSNNK